MKTTRVPGNGSARLETALKQIAGKQLKVGWVARKNYPDSDMTTAEVGIIAEYGSEEAGIPPRPIMKPVIEQKLPTWRRVMTMEVKKIVGGFQTMSGALEVLGLLVAGQFRKQITDIQEPPLKERTIRGRVYKRNKKNKTKLKYAEVKDNATFKKPLVFDGIFLGSLTHSVEDDK